MSGTISHEWNGTVLTITSDSGTSSADLKGEKGDTGIRGAQGAVGEQYKPQKGIDYFTEEELAQINANMQNYVNTNAAPSGYGLGKDVPFIGNCDDVKDSGFSKWDVGCANSPFDFATMLTMGRYSGSSANQIAFCNAGYATRGTVAIRTISDGIEDWSFINPPMHAGVEYKTAEKYLNNPVYTILVNCGAWAVDKGIEVSGRGKTIRYAGEVGGLPLPFTGTMPFNTADAYEAWLEVNQPYIYLRGGSGFAGRETTVQLWYIK